MPILSTLAFAVRRGRQCVFSTPRYLPKYEGPNAGQEARSRWVLVSGHWALEVVSASARAGRLSL